jgi:hypothetical protein
MSALYDSIYNELAFACRKHDLAPDVEEYVEQQLKKMSELQKLELFCRHIEEAKP